MVFACFCFPAKHKKKEELPYACRPRFFGGFLFVFCCCSGLVVPGFESQAPQRINPQRLLSVTISYLTVIIHMPFVTKAGEVQTFKRLFTNRLSGRPGELRRTTSKLNSWTVRMRS